MLKREYAAEVVKACVCLHNLCLTLETVEETNSLLDLLPTFYSADNSVGENDDNMHASVPNNRRRNELITFFT